MIFIQIIWVNKFDCYLSHRLRNMKGKKH